MCIRDSAQVVADLEEKGAVTCPDIDAVPDGYEVIIRSHGAVSYTHLDVYKRQAMLMVFFVWRMFYADKKEKKDLGILLAWGAVAALGIIVYCASFSNQFGIFSLTDAGPRQDLRVCVDRGYYKDFADEDARQIVEDAIAEDTGICLLYTSRCV